MVDGPHWPRPMRDATTFQEAFRHFAWKITCARREWNLTARQTEVLACVFAGHCNKDIAKFLGCKEGTVEDHVTSVLSSSRCTKRSQLQTCTWLLFGPAPSSFLPEPELIRFAIAVLEAAWRN